MIIERDGRQNQIRKREIILKLRDLIVDVHRPYNWIKVINLVV